MAYSFPKTKKYNKATFPIIGWMRGLWTFDESTISPFFESRTRNPTWSNLRELRTGNRRCRADVQHMRAAVIQWGWNWQIGDTQCKWRPRWPYKIIILQHSHSKRHDFILDLYVNRFRRMLAFCSPPSPPRLASRMKQEYNSTTQARNVDILPPRPPDNPPPHYETNYRIKMPTYINSSVKSRFSKFHHHECRASPQK